MVVPHFMIITIFSAKIAATWARFQLVTCWSNVDTELFCRHFASQKSPTCGNCQSSGHTSNWCPNMEHPIHMGSTRQGSNGSSTGPSGQVDKLGRPINYLGKAQLCNNFNYMVCKYNQCRLLYIYANCFRAHPKSACPIKSSSSS